MMARRMDAARLHVDDPHVERLGRSLAVHEDRQDVLDRVNMRAVERPVKVEARPPSSLAPEVD